ncbi:MAG: hypothetical protein LC785_07440 [Acidobacteria bacterium]|nr:hypothetical protein [Acidobacteriota bacterium]MCA1641769.1 hypothetical protein [Acidobacteriota bacterium]
MHIERNAQVLRRGAARLAAVACLLLSVAGAAFGQNAQTPAADQEFTVTDLLKLPGKVVARGTNTTPRGLMKLRSYRVEEVALPRVTNVEVGGQRVEVTKAFRVTLTGAFPVRALPAVIWLDDVAIGYGIESEDLDEITVVTYDASAIKDGATIYISYGDKENKKERTALPEKLKLGTEGVKP